MASTYTPSLKIELMATGDQVNEWGATTNSNLENGLEQAIVGRGVVEYTSDANKTITLTESNSSQDARNLFLYVDTDAFTTLTATRDLIVPTIEKTYVVHNDTAGSQSIRVKTSGGTGITIPNGKKVLLYVDGTNVIEQLNYLTSMEIGTPLPIASGGTNATSASAARASLGLAIGTNVQAYNAGLQDISGLAKTDGNFIVGDGTNWVAESGATVRTSLGLGSMAVQNSNAVSITGGTITGITDLAVADGGTGSSSLTLNSVLIGNGTSPLLAVAPSTAGNVLTSSAGAWISSPAVNSFSAGTTGLTPNSATTGAVSLAGTLVVANGGTGVTSSTGTTNVVLSNNPTLVAPALGTPASGNLSNCTDLNATQLTTGTVPIARFPVGSVLQVGTSQSSALSTTTATIPADNSIPQISEGVQVLSLAFTPISATSKLFFNITVNCAYNSGAASSITTALFQGATASAIAAGATGLPNSNYAMQPTVNYSMTSGTTSSITFTVRAGSSSGTTTINGINGSALFGGVGYSSITITEIAA